MCQRTQRSGIILIIIAAVFLFTTMSVVADCRTDVRVNDDIGEEGQAIGAEKTAVVIRDDIVYAVWQDWRNVSDNLQPDIYFAKGTIGEEGNATFGDNVMVNDISHSPLNDKPSAPAMAVGEDGIIYVVWTDMRNIDNQLEGVDVYLSRSTNDGSSFETNQLIGSTTGGSGAASIAVSGSHVYVVYEHCCDPANNVLDFVVSSDNGQSFSPLETIYIPSEGENGAGQPVIDAEGSKVYVAFLLKTVDYANQIAVMISNDYGATFSDPVIINDDEGDYTQASVSIDVSGDYVYLSWHDFRVPVGIYFSVSTDGGESFSANQLIAETGSTLPNPVISAHDQKVAISYCGGHEGIYGFVVLTKISKDGGDTWGNASIVSDADVSRSGIGPSAVSVCEDKIGYLWIDSRGTWDENVYFDWCDFLATENGNGNGNGDGDTPTTPKTPGFEIITLMAAIAIALIIIRRKKQSF